MHIAFLLQVARRSPPIFWSIYRSFPDQSVQESLDELRRKIRFRAALPSDEKQVEREAADGVVAGGDAASGEARGEAEREAGGEAGADAGGAGMAPTSAESDSMEE